jgi:hypothetical protein
MQSKLASSCSDCSNSNPNCTLIMPYSSHKASQETHCILQNIHVHYCAPKNPLLQPILSLINPLKTKHVCFI